MALLKTSTPLSKRIALVTLSVVTFFFSGAVSLTIYIDSSFLKDTVAGTPSLASNALWSDPDDMVGTIYALASLLTIVLLTLAPIFLRKYGNYLWTRNLVILYIGLLVGLSMTSSGWLLLPMFIVEIALVSVLYYNLDIFLEHYSDNKATGKIRGAFLVIGSISWLLPPIFAGYIVDQFGYPLVYLTAAMVMVPVLFLHTFVFKTFSDSPYKDVEHNTALKKVVSDKNIRNSIITTIFLHFFYSWMVIYTPLYLHDTLGWDFKDIGVLLTIALSAFVVFPYFAGKIADTAFGEKELMVTSLILMSVGAFAIPKLAAMDAPFYLWAMLFFVGRTGASILETMCEAYFFKQIDGGNAALIGYFRRTRPIAYIVGPLLASFLFSTGVIEIGGLFTLLGFIMLGAIYFPLTLKDTK